MKVPLLKPMLLVLSYATEFLWLRLGQTPSLTPNRIVKLFSDTSYDDLPKSVDRSLFKQRGRKIARDESVYRAHVALFYFISWERAKDKTFTDVRHSLSPHVLRVARV